MVDLEPAPGWWLASDGRWYPPELHPDIRAAIAIKPVVHDHVEISEDGVRLIDQFTPIDQASVSTRDDHIDALDAGSELRFPAPE